MLVSTSRCSPCSRHDVPVCDETVEPCVRGDSSHTESGVHSTSCESPPLHLARSQIPRACVCVCVCVIARARVSLWEQGPTVLAYHCLAWTISVRQRLLVVTVNTATS